MAGSIAPNINENNLILCLDASNIKSYSGAGSTWYDLSRNEYDSSLVNGPSFNTNYGGSLTFDGTNDYCVTGLTQNPVNFSFECIFKFNDITGLKVVAGKFNGSGNDYWMGLNLSGNIVFSMNTSSLSSGLTGSLNIVQNVTCVLGTTTRQIWVNGELKNSTATTTCSPNGNLVLGDFGVFTSYPTAVDIYSFKFWERELTPDEIYKNFLSTRSRFNI